MVQDFNHRSAMVAEVVDLFRPVPPGTVVDATAGAGGHSDALLRALPQLSVVAVDRDPDAVAAATDRLARHGRAVRVVQARFDALADVAAGQKLVGVLFDLGVSSPQIDRPERGFSYRRPGPLDMRMGPDAERSAADVINGYPEQQLAAMFREAGESRFARRIAAAIVRARPITDTAGLAEVVAAAVPAPARRRGHPAGRVFQAVRIEVNGELDALRGALEAVPGVIAPRGRVVVISYHSGEDRLVKARFLEWSTGGCTCPPGLPCVCGAVPQVRLLTRGARKAGPEEIADNPRVSAARLRAVEWLEMEQGPDQLEAGRS